MIGATPHADRNLILTGYVGPNQVVIVRRIAERLGMPYVSFESRLEERADLPLEDIRIRFGEARLKTLEAEVVQEMVLHRGAVILIGGQPLMHSDYRTRLAETGMILCLVASLDAVLQRLHLSLGARFHNPSERAIALGNLKRDWTVRGVEGIREFDTTTLTEASTIDAVVALWREQALLVRG